MKHFLYYCVVLIAAVCFSSVNTFAQSYSKEGKVFTQVKSSVSTSSNDVETSYTWKDTKGNEYPIILHQYQKGDNAGKWTCYVIKISEKTGKNYKYYLPSGIEVAEDIRKEMNI